MAAISTSTDKLINRLHVIAEDSTNYPYFGFLSKGMTIHKDAVYKSYGARGMNCWGAIFLASYEAELISKETMFEYDKKMSVSAVGKNELFTERAVFNEGLSIPKGMVISTITLFGAEGEVHIGDHVFLSMGQGTGSSAKMLEVDSASRGLSDLGEILSRHLSKTAEKICTLYLWMPPWCQ